MFKGRGDTLFSGKRDILPSRNDFILWESDNLSSGNGTTFPLGMGPLILWDSGHSLGNGTHSGIRTTYPLGIGNLGDEAQPFKVPTVQSLCFLIRKFFQNKNKTIR